MFPILQQLPQDIIRLRNLMEFTANILKVIHDFPITVGLYASFFLGKTFLILSFKGIFSGERGGQDFS